jgi:DNA-binding beta-propeller fold protein YncE
MVRRVFLITFALAAVGAACALPAEPQAGQRAPHSPRFVRAWGKKGAGEGEFHTPISIAVSKAGHLFVADFNNRRVQKFDPDGKFLGLFPVPGKPGGIALDAAGQVWVSLWGPDRIAVFTGEGKPLRQWGKTGRGDGEFKFPAGLAVGPDGSVYLADDVNRRIQRFSPEGKFLGKWGKGGTGPGEFGGPGTEKLHPDFRTSGPSFLAFDGRGVLHATDGRGGRVHRFTADGKFLSAWGSNEDRPGAFGGRPKNLPGPTGIAFDGQGRVWVAATSNRVQLFTAEGKYLTGFGKRGAGPGEFRTPHGLAVDGRGRLYVADTQNHRIQQFAP